MALPGVRRLRSFLKRKTGPLDAALADLRGGSGVTGVIGTIDPGDGMYLGDNRAYFAVGHSALRCIRVALLAAGRAEDSVASLLDLACGHGRVLRTLKAAFPSARLTACDINRKGVDFCARTFGALPVYAAERPEEIPLTGPFDLIWSGSLFTHLSADRWTGFIELMGSRLAPGGLAVFTTHGRSIAAKLRSGADNYGLEPTQVAAILQGYDADGFGFGEQDVPAAGRWGISVSRPSWVVAQLEKHADFELLVFTERGWALHQDVVAFRRRSAGSQAGPT